MKPPVGLSDDLCEFLSLNLGKAGEINEKMMATVLDQAKAAQTYWLGLCRSITDFVAPSLIALNSLTAMERDQLEELPSPDSLRDFFALKQFVLQMVEKAFIGGLMTINDYQVQQMQEAFTAWPPGYP
jgi:hypothetical protein